MSFSDKVLKNPGGMMKKLIFSTVFLLLSLFSIQLHATNKDDLNARILSASSILQQIKADPSKGIPKSIFEKAKGVVIFPNVIKAGFIIGGMFGNGLMVNKLPNGTWSDPSFVSIGGGSVGFQIGAAGVALVLVVMNDSGIKNIANGNVTLGTDVGIAAGPVGRNASAKAAVQAGILSYSMSEGLFAGISIEGGVIAPSKKDNETYYGDSITVNDILFNPPTVYTNEIKKLINALDNY